MGINIKHEWNFGWLCFIQYKDKQGAYEKYVFKCVQNWTSPTVFSPISENFMQDQKLQPRQISDFNTYL